MKILIFCLLLIGVVYSKKLKEEIVGGILTTTTAGVATSYEEETLLSFIKKNRGNLAEDISKGRGEYLNTLFEKMGVKEYDRYHAASVLQKNYKRIFFLKPSNMSEESILEDVNKIFIQENIILEPNPIIEVK